MYVRTMCKAMAAPATCQYVPMAMFTIMYYRPIYVRSYHAASYHAMLINI